MDHTPTLETERLRLRRFTERDAPALFNLLRDEEVNTFLPFFPLKSLREAEAHLQTNYLDRYRNPADGGCHYAVCWKEDDIPIGYLHAGGDDSHDFGYALQKKHWRKGVVTEAGRALLDHLRREGLPYVTATHDVRNPRSGAVMRRLGMTYCYTYEEQWQPKDFPVHFRMYQLNLDGRDRVYRAYWDRYPVHFVEEV